MKSTDMTYYVMMVLAFLAYIYNKICDAQDAKKEHFSCCNEKMRSVATLQGRVNRIKQKANSLEAKPITNEASKIRKALSSELNKLNKKMEEISDNSYNFKKNFDDYHPMGPKRKDLEAKTKDSMNGVLL